MVSWAPAHEAVQSANANQETVKGELVEAAERWLPVGRVYSRGRRWVFRDKLALIAIPICVVLTLAAGWLAYGAWLLAVLINRLI